MNSGAERPEETGRLSRAHGLQWPLHPLQVLAWVVIAVLSVLYFGVTVPGIPFCWQPAAYIIFGVCLAVHIACLLAASRINPADDHVLRKTRPPSAVPFNRSLHKHVIENLYCNICLADVGPKTKHCGACNKCISDFDHHCKWLNNCVGGKNYRWFTASLATGWICCAIITALCVLQFVAYFTDSRTGSILQQYSSYFSSNASALASTAIGDFQIMHASVPHEAWLAVTALEAVLTLVALLLLGHLIVFHIYLRCKGLSTYDYVIMDRSQEDSSEKRPTSATRTAGAMQKCWQKKAVAPASKMEREAAREPAP